MNPGFATDVFVVRCLIGVLKPAPSTDVENKDSSEIDIARYHIAQQLLEPIPFRQGQTALSRVEVCFDDFEPASLGERGYGCLLIVGRVSIVLGRQDRKSKRLNSSH